MSLAHIAGMPLEETLLAFGGPAALVALVAAVSRSLREASRRLRPSARAPRRSPTPPAGKRRV